MLLKTNITVNNSGFRKPWGKRQLWLLSLCNFLYRLSILVLVNFRLMLRNPHGLKNSIKFQVWSDFNLKEHILKRMKMPWSIHEACKYLHYKVMYTCVMSTWVWCYDDVFNVNQRFFLWFIFQVFLHILECICIPILRFIKSVRILHMVVSWSIKLICLSKSVLSLD